MRDVSTPGEHPIDEDWWNAVLDDPRVRCRPEDLEDGYLAEDDFGDWTPND